MKKIIIIISMSFLLSLITGTPYHSLMAQDQSDSQEMKTIFGNKQHTSGGYGALSFGYTKIDGKDAFLAGIKGGWLVDHIFTLGFVGYGFINDVSYPQAGSQFQTQLGGGYGGLLLEPIFFPNFPVHFTIPVIIGAGGITYFEDYEYSQGKPPPSESYDGIIDSDAFFVFEPGLELELNVTEIFRLAIGGSYRYTSNVVLVDHEGDILRNFNGYLTLKFGKF